MTRQELLARCAEIEEEIAALRTELASYNPNIAEDRNDINYCIREIKNLEEELETLRKQTSSIDTPGALLNFFTGRPDGDR